MARTPGSCPRRCGISGVVVTLPACQPGSTRSRRPALLGDQPWLVGRERSLADAYFIGIARWTKYHGVVDRRDYPALQRLFDKLEADPAVRFARAIEAGQPAIGTGGFAGSIALDEALALRPGAVETAGA